MSIRTNLLLAGAMLAVAGQANAVTGVTYPLTVNGIVTQVTPSGTSVFGGGSSLIAPYLRQAADCWGDKVDLASNGNAATQPIASYSSTLGTCGNTGLVSPGDVVSFISTGSGRGILGWLSHTPFWAPTSAGGNGDSWLSNSGGATLAPAVYANKVNFGASDAALPQQDLNFGGDLNTYQNGGFAKANGNVIQIADQNGNAPTGTAPSGLLVTTLYANPQKTYGPAVQIPLLVAAPAIAYSPIYKKVRKVQGTTDESLADETQYTFGTLSITIHAKLTVAQLCGIFQGQITNYNDARLAGSGFVKNSKDTGTFSVPLQIVGRSDGSGTTSIVYRHLAKVCGTTIYVTDANGNVPTSLPTSLQGPVVTDPNGILPPVGETPGLFTRANGSGAVSRYLANLTAAGPNVGDTYIQGRIGYVGEDFVYPYVTINRQNTYNLNSASLANHLGAFVAVTPTAASKAFSVLLPPQTSTAGVYTPTAFNADGTGKRSDPAANNSTPAQAANKYGWTSAANVNSPLADPVTASAYPLVGTTQGLFYQCYKDANEASVIRRFLQWYYSASIVNGNGTTTGILPQNGFATVGKAYQNAITETFITNPAYKTGKLNLDIQQVAVAPECTGVTTGA